MTPDHRAMKAEIEAELARRNQEGFASLVRLHGGMEGWHRACSARRRADPEHQMAKLVCRLLASRGTSPPPTGCAWTPTPRWPPTGDRSPRPGRRAGARSATGLREVERQAAREDMPGRLKMLDVYAVKFLLPTWQAWGRVIMEVVV